MLRLQMGIQRCDGLLHVGGKGGMREQKALSAPGQCFVELRIHLVDIATNGIFDVVALAFAMRESINLPFLMEEAIGRGYALW